MTDKNKTFIEQFVKAAKENNEEEMKTLAATTSESSVQDRVELLEELIAELKKTEANKEVELGLEATLNMLRLADEAAKTAEGEDKQDSTGAEGKDNAEHKHVGSKLEEATQDVAADTSADEAVVRNADEGEKAAESDGEAPAKEEKEEKSEDK